MKLDHIGGVMVIVFTSSVVDSGNDPRSGQFKVYKTGIVVVSFFFFFFFLFTAIHPLDDH
jgi:hypothetical protein